MIRHMAKLAAQAVQANAASMTGTELNTEDKFIPDFQTAKARMNMLERPVGFICKSTVGRVVRLLQNYDSDIYTGEPEELPAQWVFIWSDDPAHAKEFISLSTSTYMKGNCCLWEGEVYRSTIDNNVWSPADYLEGWEKVEEGNDVY